MGVHMCVFTCVHMTVREVPHRSSIPSAGRDFLYNVMQGTYRYLNGQCIKVAIKILVEALENKDEIMQEAKTMSVLDHENIVRLIGGWGRWMHMGGADGWVAPIGGLC